MRRLKRKRRKMRARYVALIYLAGRKSLFVASRQHVQPPIQTIGSMMISFGSDVT